MGTTGTVCLCNVGVCSFCSCFSPCRVLAVGLSAFNVVGALWTRNAVLCLFLLHINLFGKSALV